LSIVQGPFSVAPCQTLANITIRNFFNAVCRSGGGLAPQVDQSHNSCTPEAHLA
jgi:hypothetical protein